MPVEKPASKPATFVGSSLDDLRDFPRSARRATGFQLDKVQNGEDADDWKPMPAVGSGVHEIRVRMSLARFGSCMWRNFLKRSMCCTHFRKRPGRRHAEIWS